MSDEHELMDGKTTGTDRKPPARWVGEYLARLAVVDRTVESLDKLVSLALRLWPVIVLLLFLL